MNKHWKGEIMKTYSKEVVLNAMQWMYGFTKAEARKYFRETDSRTHYWIVETFKNNARKSLYDD